MYKKLSLYKKNFLYPGSIWRENRGHHASFCCNLPTKDKNQLRPFNLCPVQHASTAEEHRGQGDLQHNVTSA